MLFEYPKFIESGGISLALMPGEVYIMFEHELSSKQIKAFAAEYGLILVELVKDMFLTRQFDNGDSKCCWLHEDDPGSLVRVIGSVIDDNRVRLASPVYHRPDQLSKKTGISFSDQLLVRFQTHVSDSEKTKIIKTVGAKDVSNERKLLGDSLRKVSIANPKQHNLLQVADAFCKSPAVKRAGPDWLQLHSPVSTTIPNDSHYEEQWHLARIAAPDGWDIATGTPEVVIAMLDFGCDLDHEDLLAKFVPEADWRNAVDPVFGGPPEDSDSGHGTCCTGIAAADSNNSQGVAGVAWGCRIMPVRMMGYDAMGLPLMSISGIIDALDWAVEHSALVINMSWHFDGLHEDIDDAIIEAHDAGIILVAASGNSDDATINYPASNPLVTAVGASNQDDHRKNATSSDGECWWGSQWGAELNVMAPGVSIWTTDRMVAQGYNIDGSTTSEIRPCGTVEYSTSGDADGRYFANFNGTSAAAPQVAGLAGLLRSRYPALGNDDIRTIIEKTAEKVGGYVYSYDTSHPNGAWNEEMGYGRINVYQALDFADVYIKDNPADNGNLPFVGDFYSNSDIVVRPDDDDIFDYLPARRDQTNYIYVRVTNRGPTVARNIRVSVRAVPFVGTEFIYSHDWLTETEDDTNVVPEAITVTHSELPVGEEFIAKFSLSSEQVEQLFGWEESHWHPCLLAEVQCDNNYCATPENVHTWQSNNLAQRNITIENISAGGSAPFPFIAGNRNNKEPYMELMIDRHQLPQKVELLLDPWDQKVYFPEYQLKPLKQNNLITFLDRTRLECSLCGCEGVLTLEQGSSLCLPIANPITSL